MSVRDRGGMSSYSSGRVAGQTVVRTLGVFVVMGVVSFLIGFFVIARLLPVNQSSEGKNAATVSTDASGNTGTTSPPATRVMHSAGARPPHKPPVVNTPAVVPGPTIDPANDSLQKPDQPDSTPDPATAPENNGDTSGASPDSAVAPSTPASESGAATPRRGHRRKHGKKAAPDTVQPAETPDNAHTGDTNDNSTDTNQGDQTGDTGADARHAGEGKTTSAEPRGLYRVQLGVFSTREAAQQEAKRIGDKGFETSVRAFSRDGRTFYRLQHGVFRDRSHAEAAKQHLSDAGVDASIGTP